MSDSATMNDDRSLVINCEKVTRTYNEGPGKLTIFSDISLQVSAGESVGIVGSSGAGKGCEAGRGGAGRSGTSRGTSDQYVTMKQAGERTTHGSAARSMPMKRASACLRGTASLRCARRSAPAKA